MGFFERVVWLCTLRVCYGNKRNRYAVCFTFICCADGAPLFILVDFETRHVIVYSLHYNHFQIHILAGDLLLTIMSNQYVPRMKSEKAFVPCTLRQGTASTKPLSGRYVDQYVTYDRWEMFDDDFTLFYNVLMNNPVDEHSYTDTVVVKADDVPNGATIISTFTSKTPPAALSGSGAGDGAHEQPPKPSAEELYGVARSIVMVQGVPFPEAMKMAQASWAKQAASAPATPPTATTTATTTATANTGGNNDTAPNHALSGDEVTNGPIAEKPEVKYAECAVSRTIGPFNKGAKFDIMAFSSLTKEGVVHRNHSEKYYVLAFGSDGRQKVPRLVRDFTKQHKPPCFKNVTFDTS